MNNDALMILHQIADSVKMEIIYDSAKIIDICSRLREILNGLLQLFHESLSY